MKKHYKLVIFDCDGTLVDSEEINNRAVSEVLISLGLTHYTAEYCMELFTGMSLQNLLKYVAKEVKNVPGDALLEAIISRSNMLARLHLQALPYAHTLLARLTHPKCVASNGQRVNVVESLEITGLNVYFPEADIFTYEQVKHGKPAPDLFLFAAEQKGVKATDCLVIEDSPTGVKAAKAAGMMVLGFTGASHNNIKAQQQLRDEMPDAVIRHLSEVEQYLE
jgi:HAD superfamily hydrolase (TIGR01509 family)